MTVGPRPRARGARPGGNARVLTAVLAAGLLALAFPPQDLLGGWLAVPALAGLVVAFRGLSWRQGAALGLAAGMAFFLVLLGWMRVLGIDAWIALSLLCAAFWGLAGALLPTLLARRGWVLGVPLLWVCVEALRALIPWGGFPWGRLGFSQAGTGLVGWAVLGGPALVSFAVALAATATLAALAALRARRALVALGWLAVIAGLGAGGALARSTTVGAPVAVQPVAVVQGNVPRLGLDFNAQRRAVLDAHVAATEQLAAQVTAGQVPQPVAVIWPENSSDIDPLRNADAAARIDQAAEAIGAPILVGAVRVNPADPPRDGHPGTVLNVGLVWDAATGPGDYYVKRHPVPFGEYLPLRGLLTRFVTRFERIPRDFAAGTEPGLLQVGPIPAGVVICFEIAYDALVRDAVRAGGQVLVVQTNNATYGRTGLPEQQLAITRVQAVASGRTTVVAATSGISAVVDPDGALAWSAPEFTRATVVASVPLRTALTPAMRVGALPEVLAALTLLAWLSVGWRSGRRSARGAAAGARGSRAGAPAARGTMGQ